MHAFKYHLSFSVATCAINIHILWWPTGRWLEEAVDLCKGGGIYWVNYYYDIPRSMQLECRCTFISSLPITKEAHSKCQRLLLRKIDFPEYTACFFRYKKSYTFFCHVQTAWFFSVTKCPSDTWIDLPYWLPWPAGLWPCHRGGFE